MNANKKPPTDPTDLIAWVVAEIRNESTLYSKLQGLEKELATMRAKALKGLIEKKNRFSGEIRKIERAASTRAIKQASTGENTNWQTDLIKQLTNTKKLREQLRAVQMEIAEAERQWLEKEEVKALIKAIQKAKDSVNMRRWVDVLTNMSQDDQEIVRNIIRPKKTQPIEPDPSKVEEATPHELGTPEVGPVILIPYV